MAWLLEMLDERHLYKAQVVCGYGRVLEEFRE